MTQLSNEQETLRASIKKGAVIGAVIVGLIVAGLAYWLLGSQGSLLRSGGAGLAGLLVAGGMYRKSMSSGAAGAKCAKCGAAFSVARSDTSEVLLKSEARESRKELDSGDVDGGVEITTWIEEVYDVDDTYTCSKCADVTHKKYQTTRKRDEKTVVKTTGKKAGDTEKSTGKSTGKSNARTKAKQSKGNSKH